ncbi:MAG: hypothetical protein ACXWCG_09685 [Flavitalea sp.]|jgi:hypothetical protein
MKFDKNKAFPYPVLRPYSDDYKEVEFQATPEFTVGKERIKTNISYAISSEEIEEEINKGNAEYVAVISCRDTYFQATLTSSNRLVEKEFDIGELRGEVRVNPYVVVKNDIESFTSPDINHEFGTGPFRFEAGDILAQDETQIFYIDRDLFKPITSVFELVKKDEQSDGIWSVDFDGEHVQIIVSPKLKESIDNARNTKENRVILVNSVYFAAVMQAIQKLKDTDTRIDYEDKKWAKIISGQAHNKGLDIDKHDAYLIAERLMQQPIKLLDAYVFKSGE